jgi:hypothetical protein
MILLFTMTWKLICRSSYYAFKSVRNTNVNLNLKKCAFMVYSKVIIGFIISKEAKLLNPKKL